MTNPLNVVAAVFLDEISARDAIADLRLVGFPAEAIGVALSAAGKRKHPWAPGADKASTLAEGKHSLRWRLRHSFEHDLHTQGADLSGAADAEEAADGPAFREIDLAETLREMGIPEVTIQLLDSETPADGLLILVDGGDRARHAESILELNRGVVRTAMATNHLS